MPIDPAQNKILKEMWRLDEQGIVNDEEKKFYTAHLKDIQAYYAHNNNYWQGKNIV